jgi:hypothetical protein
MASSPWRSCRNRFASNRFSYRQKAGR